MDKVFEFSQKKRKLSTVFAKQISRLSVIEAVKMKPTTNTGIFYIKTVNLKSNNKSFRF